MECKAPPYSLTPPKVVGAAVSEAPAATVAVPGAVAAEREIHRRAADANQQEKFSTPSTTRKSPLQTQPRKKRQHRINMLDLVSRRTAVLQLPLATTAHHVFSPLHRIVSYYANVSREKATNAD